MNLVAQYILIVSAVAIVLVYLLARLFKLSLPTLGYFLLAGASALCAALTHHFTKDYASGLRDNIGTGILYACLFALLFVIITYLLRKNTRIVHRLTSVKNPLPSVETKYNDIRIQHIRNLIAEDELSEACQTLLKLTKSHKDHERHHEVVLLNRQLQRIKSDGRKGILSNEQRDLGYARISNHLLELVGEM